MENSEPRRATADEPTVSPDSPGHTDSETAERILRAAFELFRDHGVRATTTRTIAQAAGVNEVTIFRKYKSKDGILQAITERAMVEFRSNLGRLDPQADPRETLMDLLRATRATLQKNVDWFRIVLRNVHEYPVLAEIIAQLREPSHQTVIQYIQTQMDLGRMRRANPVSVVELMFGPLMFLEVLGQEKHMHIVPADLDCEDYARLHIEMVINTCVGPDLKSAKPQAVRHRHRRPSLSGLALAAGLLLSTAAPLSAAAAPTKKAAPKPTPELRPPYPVDDYLQQVLSSNEAVAGARAAAAAAEARAYEGSLPYQPLLTAQYTHLDDQKPPTSKFMVPDGKMIDDLTVGVGMRTRYGTEGRFVHQLTHTKLDFPMDEVNLGGGPVPIDSVIPTDVFDHATYLEVSQPLVRNWAGREFNAIETASFQRAKAQGKQEEFYVRMALVDAEARYWKLALARGVVFVRQGMLKRAEEFRTYIRGRLRKGLAEQTEMMQAESQVKLRSLELRGAIDDEQAAARAFNMSRGRTNDAAVTETVVLPPVDEVLALTIPPRADSREDIEAAREGVEAARLAAAATGEKFRPQVDVFGRVGFNGRDKAYGESLGESFYQDPTWMLGFKVLFGFDLANARTVRRGYLDEADASAMKAAQYQYNFEAEYADAARKMQENKDRLLLALELEEYQLAKLNNERARLRQGISTTYQVVQFEGEYVGAVLNRVYTQSQILFYLAQMRAYSEMPAYARTAGATSHQDAP